jgi:muramoyltetrapeptide carboxypeptidase
VAYRIAVTAPAGRIPQETADRVLALAADHYPQDRLEIHFHPQCFASAGHFAGDDGARTGAFLEAANDPGFDAVWAARGGYGSARICEMVLPNLTDAARSKTYLGYSDIGALLGCLYKAGIGRPCHGPMPGDIVREGGDQAVLRALRFLVDGDPSAVEATPRTAPTLAYNIAVLSSVLGTSLEPPFKDHVLMLEEVGEYMYRLDRYVFHVTSQASVRQVAGIRLGRVSQTLANVPEFGAAEEAVIQTWCARADIPYLGRADIGHDVENKVVVFG